MAEPGPALTRLLAEILPPERFSTDLAECLAYGVDNSKRSGQAAAVVFPENTEEVSQLVRLCYTEGMALIPRGRGTGTAAAVVPQAAEIVLCTSRMNRIIETDPANRLVVCQPGVLNGALQDALAAEGFFWPPDPTSAAICSIGGNLAVNAAGPRAVKYGTPRENTLGLTAVTGTGEVIHTGTRTTKGVVGYDLTRLLIGSEGTLAVITEAVLKLTALPEATVTFRALYDSEAAATEAIVALMRYPELPSALEFMDAQAFRLANDYGRLGLDERTGAMLMVEFDGSQAVLDALAAVLPGRFSQKGLIALEKAATPEQKKALWSARKALSPCLRSLAPAKINEDVVVPVSRLPELLAALWQISHQYGIPIVNFGHAGNGNIHVNILYHPENPDHAAAINDCLSAVFEKVLALDGTLSGEHGIGLVKRDFLPLELGPVELDLMRRIKAQWDPKNILNPGKAIPP
jgi:D-lactate dehydrogenase